MAINGAVHILYHDRELIAAEAGERVTVAKTQRLIRCATSRGVLSPSGWPMVSLTCLKLSRSSSKSATTASLRRRVRQGGVESIVQQQPVSEPGQRGSCRAWKTRSASRLWSSRAILLSACPGRQARVGPPVASGSSSSFAASSGARPQVLDRVHERAGQSPRSERCDDSSDMSVATSMTKAQLGGAARPSCRAFVQVGE